MAPNLKEPEVMNTPQSAAPGAGKTQPVALEIAVTVNGARTVEGSDKREPFSETTLTVLVFATGAVIRLASAVATGQLLFLTNEKTKKEVVCQVVKSKSQASASGYVELQFTEAAPGFWGMRAPGVTANGAVQAGAKPLAAINSPSAGLHAKLAEMGTKSVPAPVATVVPVVEQRSAAVPKNNSAVVAPSVTEQKEIKAAPIVPAQPPLNDVKVPTLTEFLTKASGGSETRSAGNPKSETREAVLPAEAKIEQEQIAQPQRNLTVALTGQDASAGVRTSSAQVPALAAKENPAAGSYTFDFAAEEVKIPSWLEPLARNSANVPAAEVAVAEAKPVEQKLDVTELFVAKHSESDASASRTGSVEQEEVAETSNSGAAGSPGYLDTQEAVLTLSSEGPTPNFGSTLRLDSTSESEAAGKGRSNKGLILTLVAVVVLLAAAGVWYWFSNQTANAANGESVTAQPAFSEATAHNNNVNTPAVNHGATTGAPGSAANRGVPAASALNPNNGNSSWVTSGLTKPSNTVEDAAARDLPENQPEAAQVKKPVMGAVHLAAPVVNRSSSAAENDSAEPDPQIGSSGNSGADAGGLGMLSSKGKQPTAPLPVGGDVKPARLLSAIPPVYPQMARSQRLSGDVVIDALIDANGRVTTMKVLSGPALLHQSAMDALRQWKYQPATLNGQPMPMHLTVTVQFKIQ